MDTIEKLEHLCSDGYCSSFLHHFTCQDCPLYKEDQWCYSLIRSQYDSFLEGRKALAWKILQNKLIDKIILDAYENN